MKIEQYINQLLYRYQCVTVPGFGAFLTEVQSAHLDETSHSFYPPKKIVSFNPYIKNNDGLLANHLAVSEKISYEIAVSIIQNEVSSWRNKIQEIGGFSLNNIGEFSLNSEKNIIFFPVDQVNYLTASFGLCSFVSPRVKREIYNEIAEQFEEKATVVLSPNRKRKYTFLKYAAVFLLSAGFTGAYGFKYYEDKIAQETLVVQSNVQKKVNQKIQEATFYITNPLPAATLTIPVEKMPYGVVAGAFRIESNAEEQYQRLIKLGFKNAKRLAPNKYGLYTVLYGSYATYSKAHSVMKDLQKLDNKYAWLIVESL